MKPYNKTIKTLREVQFCTTITQKLEKIYEALKIQLGKDIDDFWTGYKLKLEAIQIQQNSNHNISNPYEEELISEHIDFEKLQYLATYVVWNLNYPEIYSESVFLQRFISPSLVNCMRGFFSRLL